MSSAAGPRGRDGAAKSLGRGFDIDAHGEDAGKAVTVDIGHLHTRVGLAGRQDEALTDGGRIIDTPPDCMVITDPAARGGKASGVVRSWDGFEAHLSENVLAPILGNGESLGERPLLLVEQVLTLKSYREKATQIAFEKFDAPSYYQAQGCVLGLYASARTTGMVVDLGYAGAAVCPVYEGYALPHAIRHHEELGGWELNERLAVSLAGEKDGSFSLTQDDMRFLREGNSEVKTADSYQLPDGTAIPAERLADEYFPEYEDLSQAAYDCIMRTDVDVRSDMYNNVILIGGGACLFGLKDRFNDRLTALAPNLVEPKTFCPPGDPGDGAVLGGAILTELSTFQPMWIHNQEYDESGPGIVHRKCF